MRGRSAIAALLVASALLGCGTDQSKSSDDMSPKVKAEFEKSHAPPGETGTSH